MFVFVPGSIRESGGAFGKREAALEEQYFHKIQAQQIDDLKKHHADEIEFHKREIARHQVTDKADVRCSDPHFVLGGIVKLHHALQTQN